MKIPLSWLKEYINIDLPVHQIARTLTMLGLEVDATHSSGPNFNGVVVGKVIDVQKHPNADTLVVATVSDGEKECQVVCGAPNCRQGIKTAFARVGAVLSDESGKQFAIKKTALRGVESFGMLCSFKELQINNQDEGIVEFDNHIEDGADIASMYSDIILDISLTPNLGHCVSVYGVARELSAALGIPLKSPFTSTDQVPSIASFNIQINDPQKCPRYSCCLIKSVKVAPSPDWIQKRLIASGLRPVNNVVDITNYILLEVGQPMHAFDSSKLHGATVYVNSAKEGQTFKSLEGVDYILSEGDITISDGKGIIALGGVMGGEHTKVSDETQDILLESAVFESASIRRTSRKLGLLSDSSYRFEKGVDPENTVKALQKAAQLIVKVAGGDIVQGYSDSYPGKKAPLKIKCRHQRIQKLLGIQLGTGEVESFFHRLGMHSSFDQNEEVYHVTIPSWRYDIKEEVDLIEEVARIYGYDNIPRHINGYISSGIADNPVYLFEKEVRFRLIAEGLQEFLTCDLISPEQVKTGIDKSFPIESIITVLNPSSVEQSVLRPSLLPGLLQVVKNNIDHQTRSISGFEVGRVHYKQGEHFHDQSAFGIILTGNQAPYDWKEKSKEVDFYDLKGIIENILLGCSIEPLKLQKSELSTLHPGRQASIFVGDCEIGAFGEVHPDVLKFYGIQQRVYFAEFNLHLLMNVRNPLTACKPLPIYPSSERDWTVTVDESIEVGSILNAANKQSSRLLKDVSVLDVFRGGKLEHGKKNVTLRFLYRDDKKTIAQQTVDSEHERLTNHVTQTIAR